MHRISQPQPPARHVGEKSYCILNKKYIATKSKVRVPPCKASASPQVMAIIGAGQTAPHEQLIRTGSPAHIASCCTQLQTLHHRFGEPGLFDANEPTKNRPCINEKIG
jgi:hypothetical protein